MIHRLLLPRRPSAPMRFLWFWTFWHWSREGFREGSLLRGPLHGIASHWDEWWRHEVGEQDRREILAIGRGEEAQREFICWIEDVWAQEPERRDNPAIARFVLSQLSHLPPFDHWKGLNDHRTGYGASRVTAVILSENSPGTCADIRHIQAVLLPPDPDASAPRVIAEGFRVPEAELDDARKAAMGLLGGRGFFLLLTTWLVAGQRPYPRSVRLLLAAGWITGAGLTLRLLLGPEPGDDLPILVATLLTLTAVMTVVGALGLGTQCIAAWRQGRRLMHQLRIGQVRLRMTDGLTLKGASAGLAFCLNILGAVIRATPRIESLPWVLRRLLHLDQGTERRWAATGVVTPSGRLHPVILNPKYRACAHHPTISHLLTPFQGTDRGAETVGARVTDAPPSAAPSSTRPRPEHLALGYAAEGKTLRIRRCWHVAQAVFALGEVGSRWQAATSAIAVAVLLTVVAAFPDLRAIVQPPPSPLVVPPGSPSPYYLWVSIDSESPRYFRAVFESEFWSNRLADFSVYGGTDGSIRAEIPLRRRSRLAFANEEDGVVWIERRRRILSREYVSGERVGRYHFSYLSRLKHE